MKVLIKDAYRKYQEKGLMQTIRISKNYAERSLSSGFQPSQYQVDHRVDTEQRWRMMREYIDDSDVNVLDIGCADGVLTRQFANQGLFAVGVEVSETRAAQARKNLDGNNMAVLNMSANPQNIEGLPGFDVILLLTVYHHWCRDFGVENAEHMLRVLAHKCNKLFFEPPGELYFDLPENAHDAFPNDSNSVEGHYLDYLKTIFDDDVDIEHVGTSDYTGGSRRDPLFYLHTDSY